MDQDRTGWAIAELRHTIRSWIFLDIVSLKARCKCNDPLPGFDFKSWFMLEFFLSRVFRNRFRQIEGWMNEPVRYQHELLMQTVYKGSFTGIWPNSTDLNWSMITSLFVRQVPMGLSGIRALDQSNEASRRKCGQAQPGRCGSKSSVPPAAKANTSPVTREYLEANHIQGGSDTLSILYQQYPHLGIFEGKNMIIGVLSKILSTIPVWSARYQRLYYWIICPGMHGRFLLLSKSPLPANGNTNEETIKQVVHEPW